MNESEATRLELERLGWSVESESHGGWKITPPGKHPRLYGTLSNALDDARKASTESQPHPPLLTLTDREREKFSRWLEQEARTAEALVAAGKALGDPAMNRLLAEHTLTAAAARRVCQKLLSVGEN